MSPRTKKDMVVAELRARIAAGTIKRGARIPQGALAEELETSITPVREALRELQAEGLLSGEPHHGVRVASVDLEGVKGIYLARRRLEPYAMRRAALRVSRRDLGEARRLNEAMLHSHEEGDDGTTAILNRKFHFIFYEKSGPPSFVAKIRDLWLGFPWDILQVLAWRIQESIGDHQAMIDAIEQDDRDRLEEICGSHIAGSYRALCEHLTRSDGVGDQAFEDPYQEDND